MNGRLIAAGAAVLAALATAAAQPAEARVHELAAAPGRVTISARPTVARWAATITFSGSVASGRPGELVTIEARECGLVPSAFRPVATARTTEGGNWSTDTFLRASAAVRATWDGATSAEVAVQRRPGVSVSRASGGRFEVSVGALVQFWRKHVVVERFARRLGRWIVVKRVVLTESGGAGSFSWTSGKFRAKLPKGTLIRAVLPRSQARPCYLAGYSNLLRT